MGKEKVVAKVPIQRVAADSCVIYLGQKVDVKKKKITDQGVPYQVHKGEWVDVIPVVSIEQYMALNELRTLDPKNFTRDMGDICRMLSERIMAWNFTDLTGKPYDQPYLNPDVIQKLTEHEILWLFTACRGESQEERKNA